MKIRWFSEYTPYANQPDWATPVLQELNEETNEWENVPSFYEKANGEIGREI